MGILNKETIKKISNSPRIFKGGGKSYYFVNENNQLIRNNTDGTETLVPFIKGSTYTKYSPSKEFMQTLESAFNRYGRRINNERKQLIRLSGKTKPITIKNRGTYNMPIEIFNHIVKSSKEAGIDPRQGLAIAIKESSGYTDPRRRGTYYSGNLGNKRWSAKRAKNYAGPSTVVSNWQYFDNSPYISLLKGWEDSGWDVDRVSEDARYQYKKYKNVYDTYDANLDEDIFTNLFRLPLDKINPGEKEYVPTIKQYMNNMSYKFGGKFYK